MVYWGGDDFVSKSNSCSVIAGYKGSDDAYFRSDSVQEMVYESISLIFYSAYIYGTYALVTILERGGTGDEKVIEDDVLALVKTSPPKVLVLSSTFGIVSLRLGILALCCILFGTSSLSVSRLTYRLIYTCGKFENDSSWCIWPYGIMSLIDEAAIAVTCIVTIIVILNLKSDKMISLLKFSWIYFVITSIGLMGTSLFVISENYPSYWMDNMKGDFWTYYIRFWITLTLVVLVFSIQVLRLAGGVGWETESGAKAILNENLSEEIIDSEKRRDSLDDLLGESKVG